MYDKHYQAVVRYFFKRFGADEAEDLAQQTFMKLWAYLPNYPYIKNERALIFGIAKGVLVDALRRQKSRDSLEACEELPSNEQIYESIEMQELLYSLSARDREIVALKNAGFSSREIAKIQQCKPSTIRSRLQIIRQKLIGG